MSSRDLWLHGLHTADAGEDTKPLTPIGLERTITSVQELSSFAAELAEGRCPAAHDGAHRQAQVFLGEGGMRIRAAGEVGKVSQTRVPISLSFCDLACVQVKRQQLIVIGRRDSVARRGHSKKGNRCSVDGRFIEMWVLVVEGDEAVLYSILNAMSSLGAVRSDFKAVYNLTDRPIGTGCLSSVHVAKRRAHDVQTRSSAILASSLCDNGTENVAAKVFVRSPDRSASEIACTEAAFLIDVQRHPNVVAFYGIFSLPDTAASNPLRWVIAMEWCSRGDLHDDLQANGPFFEEHAAEIVVGVLAALSHIHARGIVHRDVKAENILIGENNRPLLSDFGIASRADDEEGMEQRCGSPGYAAPEILNGLKYDMKVDIFSTGVVLYFILCGSMPFSGADIASVLRRTLRCRLRFGDAFGHVSHEMKQFITLLMHKEPKDRLCAQRAMRFAWGHWCRERLENVEWLRGIKSQAEYRPPSRVEAATSTTPADLAPERLTWESRGTEPPRAEQKPPCAEAGALLVWPADLERSTWEYTDDPSGGTDRKPHKDEALSAAGFSHSDLSKFRRLPAVTSEMDVSSAVECFRGSSCEVPSAVEVAKAAEGIPVEKPATFDAIVEDRIMSEEKVREQTTSPLLQEEVRKGSRKLTDCTEITESTRSGSFFRETDDSRMTWSTMMTGGRPSERATFGEGDRHSTGLPSFREAVALASPEPELIQEDTVKPLRPLRKISKMQTGSVAEAEPPAQIPRPPMTPNSASSRPPCMWRKPKRTSAQINADFHLRDPVAQVPEAPQCSPEDALLSELPRRTPAAPAPQDSVTHRVQRYIFGRSDENGRSGMIPRGRRFFKPLAARRGATSASSGTAAAPHASNTSDEERTSFKERLTNRSVGRLSASSSRGWNTYKSDASESCFSDNNSETESFGGLLASADDARFTWESEAAASKSCASPFSKGIRRPWKSEKLDDDEPCRQNFTMDVLAEEILQEPQFESKEAAPKRQPQTTIKRARGLLGRSFLLRGSRSGTESSTSPVVHGRHLPRQATARDDVNSKSAQAHMTERGGVLGGRVTFPFSSKDHCGDAL